MYTRLELRKKIKIQILRYLTKCYRIGRNHYTKITGVLNCCLMLQYYNENV